MKVNLLIKVQA